MLDNFIEIYNNIIELLKEIDRLNYEYKSIQTDAGRLANSNNIDEIEKQIYDLENLLLNNYESSNYFFQVTNYKKWLINNGTYIDNADYLNKKMNLMMMMCERIAYVQSCEKNEIGSQLDLEQEKFEYEKQLQKLEYEKELQKYELEQQQALEYERELQKYELEQQQAQEYERELQKYEQEMIDYENNIQANTNFNYYNDQNTSGYDQNQMGYDQSQMGYDQSQMGYDPNQMGYDQSQMGYDQSQMGYDQQQNPMGYEQSYQ